MKRNYGLISSSLSSYWKYFRLVFVVFFLYLTGDAFYRWDGFRYYASFSEFLPSLSLAALLWSFIALLTTFLIWLPKKAIELFCLVSKSNKVQRLFEGIYFIVFVGAALFIIKQLVWLDAPVSLYIKILIVGIPASIFIAWLLFFKMDSIQNSITPLVWIFGLYVTISIPIVAYHSIWKQRNIDMYQAPIHGYRTDTSRPNIIFISFDALTNRDMSVYGYHKPTTPFITEWAKNATLFKELKASSNWTASTISSLVSGKRVWTHRVFQPHAYKIHNGNTENLPNLLKQNGYYTMAYIANGRAMAPYSQNGIDDYFDIIYKGITFSNNLNIYGAIEYKIDKYFGEAYTLYDWIIKRDFIFGKFMDYASKISQTGEKGKFYPDMNKMFNTFIDDIDKGIPEPYYARIHILQPHGPYLPPKPYEGMFGPLGQDSYTSRDRYNELIRYCDENFKDFINTLTIKGKLNNTVIILSADHGESFEHDYMSHGGPHLYEQVTSIPLIIKGIKEHEGKVINDLVEQIDIPATILDLANITVPAWMEGSSLLPVMQGKNRIEQHVFSMNFEENPQNEKITKGIVAVWENNYKLIYNIENKETLLFNLNQDPSELNNIYYKEPEIGKRLLQLIHYNLDKSNMMFSSKENAL